MKKIYKNSLYMLVAGALMASCADYNSTYDFHADPDPSVQQPYSEYMPIKSYIDRTANPNLAIGATLDIDDFNKQELSHAAVMTNFDNVSFGKSLMSGTIINGKGIMNFINMMDLLDHMDKVNGTVYGSPIVANTNQCDDWLDVLTAPIEIVVEYVEGKTVNFNDSTVGPYSGTNKNTKYLASIKRYDNQNVLNIPSQAKVNIVEGFALEPNATYTTTFWAKCDKDASFYVTFSGNKIMGSADAATGKWKLPAGKWTKIVVDAKAAEGETQGYLEIQAVLGSALNIQKVDVGYYPDNHIDQTPEQKRDTIMYALDKWCDGLMSINNGHIKTFDLIDEPIDNTKMLGDIYDLKHSTTSKIFWQDIIGSENYAPVVGKIAREKFTQYNGNADELKFFISETGLEDTKKLESLLQWIKIWENNGATIDGINAKVSLVYYENPDKQAACKQVYEAMLENLARSGKFIRISNFDIKYTDADGLAVNTTKITDEQRLKLADFNAYAIKAYMSKIPGEKQAGISKSSLVDGSDPVGLWTPHKVTKDWVRTATYKAWCEALGGK